MAKLEWDAAGEHIFETGVSQGVIYVDDTGTYDKAEAWNGLTSITEKPTGAEANAQYADNIKYLNLISAEDFEATIEAFTYPDLFGACNGAAELTDGVMIGQQTRKPFGLSYKTLVGNDTKGTEYGYKLHLIYGCTAAPSETQYQTVNDNPEAATMSWDLKTVPVNVAGKKPTACLTIDSTKTTKAKMEAIEKVLYGDATTEARLPLPNEVKSIMDAVTGT